MNGTGPGDMDRAGEPGAATRDALEAGLRRVASADRLLVVSDFDGTLAAIVDDPEEVQPDPAAVAALHGLAELPGTSVAVVSGRSLRVLREQLGHTDLILVGSHGAESELVDGRDQLSPPDGAARDALDAAARGLEDLAAKYDGALVERKPTAVAFHYRKVDPARQEEAAAGAARLGDESAALRVQAGHKVVELLTGDVNKGDALDTLVRSVGATATLFVGDDRTDEHAFARLRPSDLAVKVGPGATCAAVRLPAQADVAALFRRLRALRRR